MLDITNIKTELKKLNQAVETVNFRPNITAITTDIDTFNWCLEEFRKKQSFINGNRNHFINALSVFCNEYGVSKEILLLESFKHFEQKDFTKKEIESIVNSVYRNHAHNFGVKNYLIKSARPNITKTAQSKIENIFNIRTANKCLDEAKTSPIPNCLFSEFWHEGELSILFAGAGIGKTILAVQIGNSISKGAKIMGFANNAIKQKVLYFDFELSDKQFQKRYSNNFIDNYHFDDNFYRIEIDQDAEDFSESSLYKSVENTLVLEQAKILIIDNITYLRNNLEASKDALPLMKFLKQLKKKYNLSILVLAHTPKRDLSRPVTINDLSGSSQLGNFADSIFTINRSSKDKSVRYIKQIKARATEIIYDSENVAQVEVKNEHNFTCFELIGFGREVEHLQEINESEKNDLEQAIIGIKKANPNKSSREIAKELQTNHSKVNRILRKQT